MDGMSLIMKRILTSLTISTLLFSAACSTTVPAILGVDEKSSTMTVDQGALSPDVKAYFESLGLKINEVDAVQVATDAKLEKLSNVIGDIIDYSTYGGGGLAAIIAAVFGRKRIKEILGLVAKIFASKRNGSS